MSGVVHGQSNRPQEIMSFDHESLRTQKYLWLGSWIWSVSFVYESPQLEGVRHSAITLFLNQLPLNQPPGEMSQGVHTFLSLGLSLRSCDQLASTLWWTDQDFFTERTVRGVKNNHSLLRARKGTSQSRSEVMREGYWWGAWMKTKYVCKCHNKTQHFI